MHRFLYKVGIAVKKTLLPSFSLRSILSNAVNYFPLVWQKKWSEKIH